MDRIDLHAHTNRSDGSLEPAALVALAKETGLRALAVTDHDTTSALAIAREVGRSLGVEILTGAEITSPFASARTSAIVTGAPSSQSRSTIRGLRVSRPATISASIAQSAGSRSSNP